MYEQDIQLARLLLTKLDEMTSRQETLIADLKEAQGKLIESEKVREERSSYEDVLAQAAELLERPDLKRESPQTTDLQEKVETMKLELSELEGVMEKHNELVTQLNNRAPNLVSVARAEIDGTEPPAIVEEEVEEEPAAEEPVAEVPADDEPAEDVVEEEAEPAAEDAEQENELDKVFTLKDLKSKETYTFGRGASYVIDATSVLDRVPHYDLHFRAMSESEARDELIGDVDRLSRELSGDFFLVFNSWHQPQVDFSNKVEIRNVFGEDEGIKNAANELIRELAGEMVAREKVVCVVTGDADLTSAVSGQGVHAISLSDFFIS